MKKVVPSLIGLCLTVGAVAQQSGYLGTKVSGSTATNGASGAPGVTSFVQMVVALGIVLVLLKTVVPKLAGKLNKRLVTNATSSLTIEETANFAAGNLYIVRARHKTLLLCASSTGVTCLSDLTEGQTAPEVPTFQEIVEAAEPLDPKSIAVEEGFTIPDTMLPVKSKSHEKSQDAANPSSIEIALRRIERLAP